MGEPGSSTPKYPRYEVVHDDSLAQGDLLPDFPVPVLDEPFENWLDSLEASLTLEVYDVIVLSQSCDLEHDKIRSVLVCPVFPSRALQDKGQDLKLIKNGGIVGMHMLPPCDLEDFSSDTRVVVFGQVATVPTSALALVARTSISRVRLMHPYREHLAQAFGRFVMRVGLPDDFPALQTKPKAAKSDK